MRCGRCGLMMENSRKASARGDFGPDSRASHCGARVALGWRSFGQAKTARLPDPIRQRRLLHLAGCGKAWILPNPNPCAACQYYQHFNRNISTPDDQDAARFSRGNCFIAGAVDAPGHPRISRCALRRRYRYDSSLNPHSPNSPTHLCHRASWRRGPVDRDEDKPRTNMERGGFSAGQGHQALFDGRDV